MQLHFTGHNIEVTPALKTSIQEKLTHLAHRFQNMMSVNIIFRVEKTSQMVEATVHLPGTEIHAKADDNDMYNAIDKLIDKLETQLAKHKEKQTSHH
jgi:putative sigma-54 modulation protein